jgi:hypothetical protein
MQPGTINKDHVVGRRFVPRGSLDGYWNLIVQCCVECNSKKSQLEDDISAITLGYLQWLGAPVQPNGVLDEIARKAAGSYSRMTNRPVTESRQRLSFSGSPSPGVTMSFGMVAPPQIDEGRVFQLARLQLMAFFYLITYESSTKLGGFWPGSCSPLNKAHLRDWGNQDQRWFMSAVCGWEDRLVVTTANGFFRVAIRRNPKAACWAWALEWNKSYRVIGFFGESEPIRDLVGKVSALQWHSIGSDSESVWMSREDVPLDSQDDILFEPGKRP